MFRLVIQAATAAELSQQIIDIAEIHKAARDARDKSEYMKTAPPVPSYNTREYGDEVVNRITPTMPPAPVAPPAPAPIPEIPKAPPALSNFDEQQPKVLTTKEAPEKTAPVVPAGTEVDAEGMPWDARIHAKTRAKTVEGRWRQKRNLDPEYLKIVLQEYTLATGDNGPQAAPVVPFSPPPAVAPAVPAVPFSPMGPPPVPTVAVPGPFSGPPTLSPHLEAPVTQYEPPVAIPPGEKPAHTLDSFTANFGAVLADLINHRKIDRPYIESINQHFAVKNIFELNTEQIAECYRNFAKAKLITALS